MLLHNISEADVQLADHLYRWDHLQLKSGIAIGLHEDPTKISIFTLNEFDNFCVVTLRRFKKKAQLRRAAYDQGNTYLHWIKASGTSFAEGKILPDQIVRNTAFLLGIANRYPYRIKEVLGDDLNDFARLCCTKTLEYWQEKFPDNGTDTSVVERNVTLINNHQPLRSSASRRSSDGDSLKQLEDQIEELTDKQTCAICMERPMNTVFQCGHVTCQECAQTLKLCHMCRTNIHTKTPLYWS